MFIRRRRLQFQDRLSCDLLRHSNNVLTVHRIEPRDIVLWCSIDTALGSSVKDERLARVTVHQILCPLFRHAKGERGWAGEEVVGWHHAEKGFGFVDHNVGQDINGFDRSWIRLERLVGSVRAGNAVVTHVIPTGAGARGGWSELMNASGAGSILGQHAAQ